jgi:hypothetical protein
MMGVFLIPIGAIVIAYIVDMNLPSDSKGKEQQLPLPLQKAAVKRAGASR